MNLSFPGNKDPGHFCDGMESSPYFLLLEIVIGQESQICPAFILKIADNQKLVNALDDWNREIDAFEEKTKIRNRVASIGACSIHLRPLGEI